MRALIGIAPGSFFLHNFPNNAQSLLTRRRPSCCIRKQSTPTTRSSLKTTWPSLSFSLFGSGFFLGPLIDGIHSRVELVVYQNGSTNIGPLHTNVWVDSFILPAFVLFLFFPKSECRFSWFHLILLGSSLTWSVLLHCRVASTLLWWKGLLKDSRGEPTENACFFVVSIFIANITCVSAFHFSSFQSLVLTFCQEQTSQVMKAQCQCLVKHIPWESSISCVVDNEVHILLLDAEHLCYL